MDIPPPPSDGTMFQGRLRVHGSGVVGVELWRLDADGRYARHVYYGFGPQIRDLPAGLLAWIAQPEQTMPLTQRVP